MNKLIRFGAQIGLLLTIWLILWSGQFWKTPFILENISAFIAQILVVLFLIYIAAPKYLFTKRYLHFIGISVLILILANLAVSYFSPQIIEPIPRLRGMNMPPDDMNPREPHRPPSEFLTQSLLIVLSYILATVIEVIYYNQKNEEALIKSKAQTLNTELKLLKSQINPHFLFNALNNIYALSGIDTEKTQKSISYLSDMLRYVLYECEQPLVSLQKEMDYIDNYIKLFRLKSSKTYPIKTEFNVSNPNIMLSPMLLIPFVENAFKHSNIEKIKDTFITIYIETTAQSILFKIENSIPEAPVNKDELGGIGLENVKKRLAIIYPNTHELKITTVNNTFSVSLKLEQHV
ncbi:GHKL domain-containing protein [Formosa sediminum]|uniref:GHKL domain-containing protein n=1 Tax=Formosa sediminum TaxID=2594004 RepID=A0A516GTW0_9FLAO|nr:histidine kinase [Formosa sediminum]QDO94961.1 GHKL domain-containing protein [Formosa sediminum]